VTIVPGRLRRLVVARARDRCEYFLLAQAGQEATLHVDYVVPLAVRGRTAPGNLALACVSCSLRKEARRSAVDPTSGRRAPIFNPRRQRWPTHFAWAGNRVVGRTPTGRATVAALRMNRPLIVAIRTEEALRGRHPPGD
jgi:hypothetical protein